MTGAGKAAAVPPIILAVLFLIALVFAANNANVISWLIAIIALGWLVLATFVYVGVVKAANFGAAQVRRAQASMNRQNPAADSTRLVEDTVTTDGVRETKLDHSFKIVQVQARIIRENLAKLEVGSAEHDGAPSAEYGAPVHSGDGHASSDHSAAAQIVRAVETIETTAHNGRDMLGGRQSRDPGRGGGNSKRAGNQTKSHGQGKDRRGKDDGEGPADPISGVVVD